MTFFSFLEIDLAAGYIAETVARRSGDLQIEKHHAGPWHDCRHAKWPQEAHGFDTPTLRALLWNKRPFLFAKYVRQTFTVGNQKRTKRFLLTQPTVHTTGCVA